MTSCASMDEWHRGVPASVRRPIGIGAATLLLCVGGFGAWSMFAPLEGAVVGLGGLGHMAVKLAKAMGADVTVFSTSPGKEADAKRLGADSFVVSRSAEAMEPLRNSFAFILDTVSAPHALEPYLGLLVYAGTMVVVGVPPEPTMFNQGSLIMGNRVLAGSLIGGIAAVGAGELWCVARPGGRLSDRKVASAGPATGRLVGAASMSAKATRG